MLNQFFVISNFAFRYTLIVENVYPIIAHNNENGNKAGEKSIAQQITPAITDIIPDSLNKFIYKTLLVCSLIFSNSSFINTTSFCISASFAFEPIVFTSLPISCPMKFNLRPPAGSFMVLMK